MPEFYTWAILLINQQDEIGEKQLSVFGSRGGQNSPLMHVPLYLGMPYLCIFVEEVVPFLEAMTDKLVLTFVCGRN